MNIAEMVIDSVDWSTYSLLGGSAAQFGEKLAEFISNEDVMRQGEIWRNMENHVFAQDDIFSAAEPTIRVLMASLVDERPRHVRIGVVDLLFHFAGQA